MSCLRERGLRGLYGIVVSNSILLPPTPPPFFFGLFALGRGVVFLLPNPPKKITLSASIFKVLPLSLRFSILLLHKIP